MKTTKILLGALRVSALVAVVLAFAASAQAQTVNVSFLPNAGYYNGTSGHPASLGTDYTGLGAASDSGTFWNSVFPSYGNTTFSSAANTLENSTDTALTTVGFTLTGYHYGVANQASTFANPLLQRDIVSNTSGNDGIGADGAPQGFEVTGLTAGGEYNLYIYAQDGQSGANNGVATFTFGTSKTVTNTALGDTAFNAGVNYVEFTLTADGSGDISGTWYATAGNDGINGFQIQSVEAPEPSTIALLGLGGLAFLAIRRRHSLV